MLKDYVLGAEIADKGDFHIANISMLFNELLLVEGVDFLKYGGITLLNKKSLRYPKYIREVMFREDMTDLSDLLALTYFEDVLENNTKYIANKFEMVKVQNKKFVKVNDDELKDILMNEKLVKSIVKTSEVPGLISDNLIRDNMEVSKTKSLVWY